MNYECLRGNADNKGQQLRKQPKALQVKLLQGVNFNLFTFNGALGSYITAHILHTYLINAYNIITI